MEKKTKPMRGHGTGFKTMHKEIRNKSRQTKEEWLNEVRADIERLCLTDKTERKLHMQTEFQ